MSRLTFRAAVAHPRPASAWAMVAVASASLWITGQLAPLAIAVQGAAIVLSLWRRTTPFAWQRHALPLNLGMACVSGTTIAVALQGHPSTVALAHFAALAQALQLLDARPRKSEFLLVALALFQVILAANLTDSLLFPLLLVGFVVSTTWTLIVHTLRTEAIEAGADAEASRAITPTLLRTTLLAATCSIALAALIFVLLPRMRTGMIQGGVGSSQAVAGFSDRVELGAIGKIRQDGGVVLRVETLDGEAPIHGEGYWRGLAFDTFDGRDWSITPQHRSAPGGAPTLGVVVDARRAPPRRPLTQQIVREPVAAGVLFGAGHPRRITGPLSRIEMDVNGGVYAPTQGEERIRYTVESEALQPSDAELAGDRSGIPAGRILRPERFTSLPAFEPAVAELARSITAGTTTDAERARRIEAHLREQGRYTDSPPPLGVGADRAPIEDFLLGDLAGHCEYFASAMVVLARSVGMPSRLVNGFAGGRVNPLGGFIELTRSDAHAWVEVHYENAGWVRYDPTPPDLRLRAAAAANLGERIAQLGSVIELWWFQRVVDFDTSDQIQTLRAAWGAWQGVREAALPARRDGGAKTLDRLRVGDRVAWTELALAAVAAALAFQLWHRWRARSRKGLPADYARALRLLARRGLLRGSSTTARDFAGEVRNELGEGPARPFERLTNAYLAERFGGTPAGRDTSALLTALRRSL